MMRFYQLPRNCWFYTSEDVTGERAYYRCAEGVAINMQGRTADFHPLTPVCLSRASLPRPL